MNGMEATPPFFAIEDLSKELGGNVVLDGIHLTVNRGESLVLIGRSGEGKSVFLKHLLGLMTPDRGDIRVDGESIVGLREAQLMRVRKKIGVLFQDGALFDSLTVGGNVVFPLVESGVRSRKVLREKARKTLALVGLEEAIDEMPINLSGGMRKRVALARAVIHRPDSILYDEPTSGLDPIVSDSINHLIRRMGQEFEATSVVVTHDLKTMDLVADKVAMLKNGKICFLGTPREIRASNDPVVRQFIMGERDDVV